MDLIADSSTLFFCLIHKPTNPLVGACRDYLQRVSRPPVYEIRHSKDVISPYLSVPSIPICPNTTRFRVSCPLCLCSSVSNADRGLPSSCLSHSTPCSLCPSCSLCFCPSLAMLIVGRSAHPWECPISNYQPCSISGSPSPSKLTSSSSSLAYAGS